MASLSELLYDIKRISEHRKELTDKKIRKIYQSLSKSLDAFIADGYKKYADNDGRFYISYLDAQNKKAKFLREIAENVASVTPEIKKEILNLVDDTYSKSYQGMITAFKEADTAEKFEDITKGIEVNPNVLKSAVDNNINKLTLPAVLEKHRQEVIYQIQKELNIGLMQGDRYEKMAKRISERVNVSYNKAMNITRTETHRNIESGFMDCAEHIQEGLENSNFIYAVTWRTMKDERVRPNQRRKTKKGWGTSKSKNGANHQKMEGVTVKVGELFDLGDGVKAKAPSQTGVAGHDCNCRCFLEYNLMTVEEFEKATGKKVKKVTLKMDLKFFGRTDKDILYDQIKNGDVDEEEFNKCYKYFKSKFKNGVITPIGTVYDKKDRFYHIAQRHNNMISTDNVDRIIDTLENPLSIYITKDKFGNEGRAFLEKNSNKTLIVIERDGIITSYEPEKNYLERIKGGVKIWG